MPGKIPTGSDAGAGKAEDAKCRSGTLQVPTPENPLWYPQVAKTGQQGLASSLPKFGLSSTATHTQGQDAGLYSTDTLPSLEQFELPLLKAQKVCAKSVFLVTLIFLVLCLMVCCNHTQSCQQGHSTSSKRLSGTWQIRSDSARANRSPKAAKSAKLQDTETDEADDLPAVPSTTSVSTGSTLDTHPEICTGNDVVEFYAKYGQDSPIKFFYCNR